MGHRLRIGALKKIHANSSNKNAIELCVTLFVGKMKNSVNTKWPKTKSKL